ncbi:TetR/AcrR family transcriptional regulator [Amycolatopsis thermalba]|uniref:TetR/AcrR family transcriptional regulator n=1 Tax=Amycolatopsis thermalba TaxID=944492 RepID=A0ABY4NUV6_9PSEU|nr:MULTISPECIES: TetR/AcrR family transcriptional regulator [Amycolatopsis]UQS23854.1 TetR/AcrR family transcriptional regulator [Amycolatopsis thermalba]
MAAVNTRRERTRLPAAQRRRQILDVATRLIGEGGFWALSMQDVADACGLTVPGLLHHVGSKDGLLLAVLDHRDAEDFRSLAGQLGLSEGAGGWPRGISLAEACEALVRRNATQPEIVRLFSVLQAESLAPGHPAAAYFAARQERVLAEFTAMVTGRVPDPESLARQVMAVMDGLQIQWLRDPAGMDLVAEWRAAAARLFAGP